MNKLQTTFEQLIADQTELQRKFQEQAQGLFKEITKEFFDKNPGITGVVWTQYTPYFNDGDSCEFCVGDPTFTNAPIDELSSILYGEYTGDTEGVWAAEEVGRRLNSDREWYKEIAAALAERYMVSGEVDAASCDFFVKAVCSAEMRNVMLAMFGDHVKVIATRDGFEVDGYVHD